MANFLITSVAGPCSLTQVHDATPLQESRVMSDLWDLLLRLDAPIFFRLRSFLEHAPSIIP